MKLSIKQLKSFIKVKKNTIIVDKSISNDVFKLIMFNRLMLSLENKELSLFDLQEILES